jgi:hypothetical protein
MHMCAAVLLSVLGLAEKMLINSINRALGLSETTLGELAMAAAVWAAQLALVLLCIICGVVMAVCVPAFQCYSNQILIPCFKVGAGARGAHVLFVLLRAAFRLLDGSWLAHR